MERLSPVTNGTPTRSICPAAPPRPAYHHQQCGRTLPPRLSWGNGHNTSPTFAVLYTLAKNLTFVAGSVGASGKTLLTHRDLQGLSHHRSVELYNLWKYQNVTRSRCVLHSLLSWYVCPSLRPRNAWSENREPCDSTNANGLRASRWQ